MHCGPPNLAPFFIAYETPSGTRHGLLAYAFYANAKITKNRPSDEHRFQVKYGGDLKISLDVAIDPHNIVTTIFVGINPEQGYFVAADPLMNNPAPMSRSIEFKQRNIDEVLSSGWATWERDRRPPKTQGRPAYDPEDLDFRTEVLIGGTQEHLYDLIRLERIARGLDPGERHLAADQLHRELAKAKTKAPSHQLLEELGLDDQALFDLIDGASRLKMAVRGWVAELHLEQVLQATPGVSECYRLDGEGKPDLSLRWKGAGPILIECKNALRQTYADGRPKVDFQRTRASKGDPCSRFYRPEDFPILAACLHPVKEVWAFEFALTEKLPRHETCEGRIKSGLAVGAPLFSSSPGVIFDAHLKAISS